MEGLTDIKSFCRQQGADFVGVADLTLLREGLPVLPVDLLEDYTFGISVGIRLSDDIIGGITDRPTPAYSLLCRDTNAILDRLTSAAIQLIESEGHAAKAIPASHWEDKEKLLGNISHKAVARMAGIGWQGKSLLLVTRECGPRLRLATVLTNMPIESDRPLKNLCGKCTECVKACPAAAIKNISTESHYSNREEAIHLERCYQKLLEFKNTPGIDYTFCGVCIAACPFGKKRKK